MTMLILQTLILLAIAFLFGCIVGSFFAWLFDEEEPGTASTADSSVPHRTDEMAQVHVSSNATASPAANTSQRSSLMAADGEKSNAGTATHSDKSVKVAATANETSASSVSTSPSTKSALKAADNNTASASGVSTSPSAKSALKTADNITATASGDTTPASAKSKSKTIAKDTEKADNKSVSKVATGQVAAKKTSPSAKPAKKDEAAKDNLKLIKGIGPTIEAKLNSVDIFTFKKIAGLTSNEQDEVSERLSFPGRIKRDDWVGQAKILAKGGETEFSKRAAKEKIYASAKSEDLGKAPKLLKKAPAKGKDDLTSITGIGPSIAEKLFEIGIFSFDQISKWNKANQNWIGHRIGFPGRPEREDWVKDAKELIAMQAKKNKK